MFGIIPGFGPNPDDRAVLWQLKDVIVSSVFNAEYAALFMNARHSTYLRNILIDLGCAVGIATDTAQAKRS